MPITSRTLNNTILWTYKVRITDSNDSAYFLLIDCIIGQVAEYVNDNNPSKI